MIWLSGSKNHDQCRVWAKGNKVSASRKKNLCSYIPHFWYVICVDIGHRTTEDRIKPWQLIPSYYLLIPLQVL